MTDAVLPVVLWVKFQANLQQPEVSVNHRDHTSTVVLLCPFTHSLSAELMATAGDVGRPKTALLASFPHVGREQEAGYCVHLSFYICANSWHVLLAIERCLAFGTMWQMDLGVDCVSTTNNVHVHL